ncbi:MAG: flagellar biosynthesis protein FlhF [Lachnospiraceae bacterium]|nr:flagellar biosynthesis protein FlhF [Lachnospiraceae bacterium]
MIIKKFQGKTEEEAVQAAKKELGENIVIMNVKYVKPKGLRALWYSKTVEVTVALEEEREVQQRLQRENVNKPAASTAKSEEVTGHSVMKPVLESSQNIEKKLDSLQILLESQMQGEQSRRETVQEGDAEGNSPKAENDVSSEKKERVADTVKVSGNPEQDKFIRLLYNTMLENEVDEKYANSILEEIERAKNPKLPIDAILASVYQKMILKFGKAEGILPASQNPKVVLFIGPTSVGKTTTIAKIASQFSIEQKKRVALLTADTYRIAATEQLRTYANIMEVPFRIIYSGEELKDAVMDFKEFDYIFVDTAGHSHRNGEQMDNTRELLDAAGDVCEYQALLVLSATTKYRDLLSIVAKYKEVGQYQLIFTKLDETITWGNLLNIKMYSEAPIAYVTYGQNVPDDIEVFNAQKTVKAILSGKNALV